MKPIFLTMIETPAPHEPDEVKTVMVRIFPLTISSYYKRRQGGTRLVFLYGGGFAVVEPPEIIDALLGVMVGVTPGTVETQTPYRVS